MLQDFQANHAVERLVGKIDGADVEVQVAIILAQVRAGLVAGSLVVLAVEPVPDRAKFLAEPVFRPNVEDVVSVL
jgi:hypothetical protein